MNEKKNTLVQCVGNFFEFFLLISFDSRIELVFEELSPVIFSILY